jgi:hypothetical protein
MPDTKEAQALLDVVSDRRQVDGSVSNHPDTRAVFCLKHLVLNNPLLPTKDRAEEVRMDGASFRVDESVVQPSLRICDPAKRRAARTVLFDDGDFVGISNRISGRTVL